jgi:hypothetical protein
MFLKKSFISLGVLTLGLLGTAATANATTPSTTQNCREPVSAVQSPSGRWVHLWLCDDGWHGQITSAASQDSIWLVSAAGTPTNFTRVRAGETSANTNPVGAFGSPWKACGTDKDNAGRTVCTNPY